VFGRTARRLSRELVDAYAAANQVASERIGAIRTVRLFGAEEYESQRYRRRVDDTFGLGQRVAIADGVFTGGMFYAAQMSLLGVLYVGGGMVLDPTVDLSVGTLTSFSMYAVQLGVASSSIASAYGQLMRAQGSGQRVFEIIDRQPVTQTSTIQAKPDHLTETASANGRVWRPKTQLVVGNTRLAPGYDATVEFDNVHFGYNAESPSILRGVNLRVEPGTVTAVAGISGSGKTSLMALLSRLYLPDSGQIRLGGVDVSELDLSWLRMQVAAVPQDPVLFSGTSTCYVGSSQSAYLQ
jgi:ATP-binding cassette, subfamily B (MDR/TAP), member 10